MKKQNPEFKIKQLGNGTAFEPKETNSSFLIDIDGNYILFDCGYNVFEELLDLHKANEINLNNLHIIFISHIDDDHIGSLKSLCYYLYFNFNITPMVIGNLEQQGISYLDDLTENCAHNYYKDGEWFDHNFVDLDYDFKINSHVLSGTGFSIKSIGETNHSKLCYGLMVTGPESILYITGDTKAHKPIELICKKIAKADKQLIIFHDYSKWNDEANNVHACDQDIERVYSPEFSKCLNYYHHGGDFNSSWRTLDSKNFKTFDPTKLSDLDAAHEYINGKTLRRDNWPSDAKISLEIKEKSKNLKTILYETPLHAVEENSQYNDWRVIDETSCN